MRETVEYIGSDGEMVALVRLKNLKEQKKLEVNLLGVDVEEQLMKYAAEERFEKCPACTLCYYKTDCGDFFDNYPNDTEICERYTEKYVFNDGNTYLQTMCVENEDKREI